MRGKFQRAPRNYDGAQLTTRRMAELLPEILYEISTSHQNCSELLLATWPEIIGNRLAPMTEAVSFKEGILLVKIRNSSLHSLFHQHEKLRILNNLRQRFPKVKIDNIVFRIG
jgi:hypothetical protein